MNKAPLTIKLESGVELVLPELDVSSIEKAKKRESWMYTEPKCSCFIYEFALGSDNPHIVRSEIF